MSGSGTGRLTVACVLIAVASGLGVLALATPHGGLALRWGLIGWSIMALAGVVGAVWAAAVHGRPGSGFLLALGTCMLARLFGAALGAWGAARHGMEAVWPYLGGLAVGYVPLQLFELTWFLRKARERT